MTVPSPDRLVVMLDAPELRPATTIGTLTCAITASCG